MAGKPIWLVAWAALTSACLAQDTARKPLPPPLDRAVDFKKDVHPLLQSRCFKCHSGPNSKSGVRLDHRPEILGETSGRAFVAPGKSAESRLIHLVSGVLDDDVMPPKGPRLTSQEVGLLRAWIDQGLPWDEDLLPSALKSDHWAFQPIRRPPTRPVSDPLWIRNPIDAFVAAEHAKHGLKPAPETARRVLIRRLALDLTGVPPALEEVRKFLDDRSPDAYEKLVDRFLASPSYGERWARHWLDVARYAESDGYDGNSPRPHAWRYRDYVVDSFNRGKPFDLFLREQIAGDEVEPNSDETLIATGFLAATRLASNEEDSTRQRNDMLVDIVNATSASFLGLTMGCAQCHNHKFDPITQRDYYRLQAFFVKGMPNNLVLKDPVLRAECDAKKPPEYDAVARLERLLLDRARRMFSDRQKQKMSPEMLEALEVPEEKRTARQHDLFRQADVMLRSNNNGARDLLSAEDKALYAECEKKLKSLEKKGASGSPQVWGFHSPATSPHAVDVELLRADLALPYEPEQLGRAVAFLRVRGDVHRRGGILSPGWPEVFGPVPPQAVGARPRLALADWLTSRDNPLVARVWVNRLWHYHFGRGIVSTPGDFGVKGAPPTHPALLDWLASELMDRGWSTKHLHRLIVTSATYRQSSTLNNRHAEIDPENVYLWRWTPRRLEAEAIRDSALAAAGELDLRPGGASVPPNETARSRRRSLYLAPLRDAMPGFMTMFDAPTANESCSRRFVSTVALQPLLLLNNPTMVERARALADRVFEAAGTEKRAQVEATFQIALGRPPEKVERREAEAFLEKSDEEPADAPSIRLVQLCHVVLNLNEFVYIE